MDIVISNSAMPSKPFLEKIRLVHGDITQIEADAVVTVIPQNLAFKGSLNETLMKAAQTNMDEFILENIYKPRVGDVYALPGFELPAKHILLGIMPHFRTEFDRSDRYLSSCCRRIMDLAQSMLLQTIAFPALASGKGAYPPDRAARLIVEGITDRLYENLKEVFIVCKDEDMLKILRKKLEGIGWQET